MNPVPSKASCLVSLRAVGLTVFFSISCAWTAWSQQPTEGRYSPSSPVFKALRVGGLPAAANLVGHYLEIVGEEEGVSNCFMPSTLPGLVEASEAIVRLSIKSRIPSQIEPDTNGSFITTDYKGAVIERFKGGSRSGADMIVRMRGGFVRFNNSTTAEIRIAAEQMRIGEDVVIFLLKVDDSRPLMPFPGGVFTLGGDGRTLPRAYRSEELFKKYNGMPSEDFLEIIRSLSAQ